MFKEGKKKKKKHVKLPHPDLSILIRMATGG